MRGLLGNPFDPPALESAHPRYKIAHVDDDLVMTIEIINVTYEKSAPRKRARLVRGALSVFK